MKRSLSTYGLYTLKEDGELGWDGTTDKIKNNVKYVAEKIENCPDLCKKNQVKDFQVGLCCQYHDVGIRFK